MIRYSIWIFISLAVAFTQKINLNSASMEKLYTLNLTAEQIESLIDYRNQTGNIHDIYGSDNRWYNFH